jgi:hypothetical protein
VASLSGVPSTGAVMSSKLTALPLIKYPSGAYLEASLQVKVKEVVEAELQIKLVT